jgi:hypothetical protein
MNHGFGQEQTIAGVWRNEGDVKTAPEQFDFGLRLVVPITSLQRPRIAGSRLLRNNNDAASLTFRWITDGKFSPFWPLEWRDGKALFIHRVIETIEAVVPY